MNAEQKSTKPAKRYKQRTNTTIDPRLKRDVSAKCWRVPVSLRLPPDAADKLRAHASKALSQGDIVAELLRRWEPERESIA